MRKSPNIGSIKERNFEVKLNNVPDVAQIELAEMRPANNRFCDSENNLNAFFNLKPFSDVPCSDLSFLSKHDESILKEEIRAHLPNNISQIKKRLAIASKTCV